MGSSSQAVEKVYPKVEFKVNISLNELIEVLKSLDTEEKEFFLENLLAALSPEYLKSIEEARKDYKEGRIISQFCVWDIEVEYTDIDG